MEIVFGVHLDGRAAPELVDIPGAGSPAGADSGPTAQLGKEIVGPAGLLALLETEFGLTGPPSAQVVRVAQYQARLKAANNGGRFFSRSLAADAWATAAFCLRLRDELVASGWQGQSVAGGGGRIDDLSAVEAVAAPILAPGFGDRLNVVMSALRSAKRLTLEKITLATPREYLPPQWLDLLQLCKSKGSVVTDCSLAPAASGGDLQQMQEALVRGGAAKLEGDGSFAIVEAADMVQATEFTAAWLAAFKAHQQPGCVIIRGIDTILLDEVCHHQGLPRPGGEARSAWRAALQVLPLAFELAWEPLNPVRLLELLNLPRSPVWRGVAWYFQESLRSEPGTGGQSWQDAWTKAMAARREYLQKNRPDIDIEKNLLEDQALWKSWLENPRFDPDTGIPAREADAICRRVQRWAIKRYAADDDPMFKQAQDMATSLACALSDLGTSNITRAQLERMLDSINDEGYRITGGGAEASAWGLVDHPGQIWNPISTLIWLGFNQQNSAPGISFWQNGEVAALSGVGVELEPGDRSSLREAHGWRSAILNARDRVLLVTARMSQGEPLVAHPFNHELLGHMKDLEAEIRERVISETSKIYSLPEVTCSSVHLQRQPLSLVSLPGPVRHWQIPAGVIKSRLQESYTSIELLLGCPLSYTLKYHAHIKPGVLLDLPHDEQLIGSLAHRVVELLFAQKPDWTSAEGERRSVEIFDQLVKSVGTPLLGPGYRLELKRARAQVSRSIASLVKLVTQAGLSVAGCEEKRTRQINGYLFEGIIDLLLRDAAGRHYIIDMKWSKSTKYREKLLQDGKAIQLATYSWLMQPDNDNISPQAGFYMLKQSRLLFSAPEPFGNQKCVPGTNLPVVWDAVLTDYLDNMRTLKAGTAIARGIEEQNKIQTPFRLEVEAPCRFCNLSAICGKEK